MPVNHPQYVVPAKDMYVQPNWQSLWIESSPRRRAAYDLDCLIDEVEAITRTGITGNGASSEFQITIPTPDERFLFFESADYRGIPVTFERDEDWYAPRLVKKIGPRVEMVMRLRY